MLLLALAVALSAATGQTPAERAPRPAPPSLRTARIAGVVTAADTQTPLARVRVVLTSDRLPLPRVALTDARGRYVLDQLPAGTYRVTFSRSGYLTRPFDAAIDLAEHQQLDAVSASLEAAHVIHGRILDEDGTPLAGARMRALRPAIEQGGRTFTAVAMTTSDDRGRFRLTGVPAGTYLLEAVDPVFEGPGDDRGPLSYPPTYYPGVNTPETAVLVRAAGSSDEQGVEFQLRLVRPVSIAGRLSSHDRKPLLSVAVVMSPQLENRTVGVNVGQTNIEPDGSFTFHNVPPGRYVIRARGETERDGPPLFATFAVAVQGRDVGPIEMTLTPGAVVQGEVVVESRHGFTLPSLPALRVRAPLRDGSAFGDGIAGTLSGGGTFRLSGLMSGTHVFAIEGLTFPWHLAEAHVQGRNVVDTGFDADPSHEYRNVRLVLTDTAAGVSGVVTAPAGIDLGQVVVLAFAADPLKRAVPLRFVRVGRPAANGTYRVVGLVPGEYRVAAVIGISEADSLNPATLDALVPPGAGTPVTLREAQIASVPLRVIIAKSPESLP